MENIIAQKTSWITKHLSKRKACNYAPKPTLTSGSLFPFLGKQYELSLIQGLQTPLLKGTSLFVPKVSQSQLKIIVTGWYKSQALLTLQERVRSWSNHMDTTYKGVHITSASTRWGSCNYANSLNFTWRLIGAPLEIIDYVVIHELAHTKHKNHGPQFWKLVSQFCPSWNKKRLWLKMHGHSLPRQF